MQQLECIKSWIINNKINTLDPVMQTTKTLEEVGELQQAIRGSELKQMYAEKVCMECVTADCYFHNGWSICKYDSQIKDAIGDIVISLISLCEQLDLGIIDCIGIAWKDVKNRTGSIKDGQFIKNSASNSAELLEWIETNNIQ